MTVLLEVAGIEKSFGGIRALNGCSFTVEKGTIHGLIGPNGSGKTTLFNVLTGYEAPDSGEVRLDGVPITGLGPGKIFRLGVGRTFQLTRVFTRLSVLDNMLIAAQHQHKWLRSALRSPGQGGERAKAMELLDFVGIARLAELEAGSLSYGQRKLLELAYLLMADPDVLLLDEPAGGGQSDSDQPAGRQDQGAQYRGQDDLGGGAQHGVRYGYLRPHNGHAPGAGAIDRRAGRGAQRSEGAGRLPGRLRRRGRRRGRAGGIRTGRGRLEVSGGDVMLSLSGVCAGYGGGDVLQGVDFDVYKGGITCIVGPNGAGKSTLLAAITGLLKPRLGEVRLNGESIGGLTPRQVLSRGVVLVPQNHSLFPDMTVYENVELGAYTIKDRQVARERLERIADMFPVVRTKGREKAGSLSGGQQRLVEFARCLMLDPSLVILDEPSMGLDPRTLHDVFSTVRTMNEEGRTILLVEQNAKAGLRASTHGVVLENGKVRLRGTGREVLDHPEIAALYLGGSVEVPSPAK